MVFNVATKIRERLAFSNASRAKVKILISPVRAREAISPRFHVYVQAQPITDREIGSAPHSIAARAAPRHAGFMFARLRVVSSSRRGLDG